MKNKLNRTFLLLSVFLVFSMMLGAGKVMGSDPGSNGDPIASKSYVDAQIKAVMDLVVGLTDEKGPETKQEPMIYEVVNVTAGSNLIGGQGTEIILRSGKGLAVTSEAGGLQDMTDGIDISSGQSIPKYHLIIIPRDDNRGIYVESDAVFMVRGHYEILP